MNNKIKGESRYRLAGSMGRKTHGYHREMGRKVRHIHSDVAVDRTLTQQGEADKSSSRTKEREKMPLRSGLCT